MIKIFKPLRTLKNEVEFIEQICEDIINILPHDFIQVISINKREQTVRSHFQYINKDISIKNSLYNKSIYLNQHPHNILNLLIKKCEIIVNNNTSEESYENIYYESLIEGLKSEMLIPLFSKDQNFGGTIVGCLHIGSFNSINHFLLRQVNMINIQINTLEYILTNKRNSDISKNSFISSVQFLFEALSVNYPYMANQPFNVAYWCGILGRALNLSETQNYRLYISALIHDFGLIFIHPNIINKKGKLTSAEFEIMKKHSIYSENFSQRFADYIPEFSDLPSIIRHHHERFDGKGYPDGLNNENIPLESRILSIGDAIDSMLSTRTYNENHDFNYVINELAKHSGKQFDPNLVEIMIKELSKLKKIDFLELTDPLIPSTVVFSYNDEYYSFEGTLIKNNDSTYVFEISIENSLDIIDIHLINNAKLHLQQGKHLYEYDITIKRFEKRKICISEFEFIREEDTFSLFWELEGMLYQENCKNHVIVHKIGGSKLTFRIIEENIEVNKRFWAELEETLDDNFTNTSIPDSIKYKKKQKIINMLKDELKVSETSFIQNNTLGIIRIIFDESNEKITIPGRITKQFKILGKTYVEFQYINISSQTKDKIFRNLFKKEVEFRRSLIYKKM